MHIELRPKGPLGLVIALVVAGVIGFVAWKKSGSGDPLELFMAGPADIVDIGTMREALEGDLQNFLRLELIKEAAAQNASQDRFDALTDLKISAVTADPQGYYRHRIDFYQDRKERYVDLELRFNEPVGEERTATGSAVLSRAGHWTLMSVSLE